MNTGGIKLSSSGVGTVTPPDPRIVEFTRWVDCLISAVQTDDDYSFERDGIIREYRQAIESK